MNWGDAFMLGYIATAVIAVLPCARIVLRSVAYGDERPDVDAIVLAAFLGLLGAAVWPLLLVVAFIFQKLRAEVDRKEDA